MINDFFFLWNMYRSLWLEANRILGVLVRRERKKKNMIWIRVCLSNRGIVLADPDFCLGALDLWDHSNEILNFLIAGVVINYSASIARN